MANVKISELPIGIPSSTSIFPFVDGGTTYQGAISAITSNSTLEVTYDEIYSLYTGNTLTPGVFYIITDYQTCYDQPDFDENGLEIVGSYKVGDVEPLVVLATSGNTLSPQVYSPSFPSDKITYDITFNQTERTGNPAKGRITERIDNRNNRADYDLRQVLFRRYNMYYFDEIFQGKINITTQGDVTGIGTNFTSTFNSGDILGVYVGGYQTPTGCFKYFEILTVDSPTQMTVTGKTMTNENDVQYSRGKQYFQKISPFQSNIINDLDYFEYKTFPNGVNAFNVYIGDFANYFDFEGYPFLLSNNIFLGGSYQMITLGELSYNNSFDDDFNSLVFGTDTYNNIITNDFDRNSLGNNFSNNIIMCDMRDNFIQNYFQYNMLGDNDSYDFTSNSIGNDFIGNFTSFYNDGFENNIIGDNFRNNIIDNGFFRNEIGNNFYDNSIYYSFYNNNILNYFYNNQIFYPFYVNKVGTTFYNNILGESENIGFGGFYRNNLSSGFYNNNCIGDFAFNNIGSEFYNNTILEGFGFGFNASQGNTIGNFFYDNTIGEYFYNNTIADGFIGNQVYNYFQMNNVKIPFLNGIDFTFYYGNITGFSYSMLGNTASDNIYNGLTGTTNGDGINATFNVEVSSGSVVGVTGATVGKYYGVGNIITILGSQIGGTDVSDDLVISVTGITQTPTVYEPYNCELFVNSGNINRLSFYDSSDILTIKNIND